MLADGKKMHHESWFLIVVPFGLRRTFQIVDAYVDTIKLLKTPSGHRKVTVKTPVNHTIRHIFGISSTALDNFDSF